MLNNIPFLELFIYFGFLDISIFIGNTNLIAQELREIILCITILVTTCCHRSTCPDFSVRFKCLLDEHRHEYIYPGFDFNIEILINEELIWLFWVVCSRFFTEFRFVRTQSNAAPCSVIIAFDIKEDIRAYNKLELWNKCNRVFEERTSCHIISAGDFFQNTFVDTITFCWFLHHRIPNTFQHRKFG